MAKPILRGLDAEQLESVIRTYTHNNARELQRLQVDVLVAILEELRALRADLARVPA